MKFLAVFVTLVAVAFGQPGVTTWTLADLSEALQNPTTDPILIPYLEDALNQMMDSIHHGHDMESITIALPIIAKLTLKELVAALHDPYTNPAYIPYIEAAINKYMEAFYAGEELETVTVVFPVQEPNFVDVWPVQTPEEEPNFVDVWPVQTPEEEPSFIDVWPVQTPEIDADSPSAPLPAAPVAPAAPSSPLVQIIVNVQQDAPSAAIERPTPVVVDGDLPGWGNFI